MPWDDVVKVPGTMKVYSMICENYDKVRQYRDDLKEDLIAMVSCSSKSENVDERVNETENVKACTGDWVIVMYDSKRYPGKVASVDPCDNMGVTVSVMHTVFPSGWKWPDAVDENYYQQTDMIF